ncbi:MAG: asparagine--tRNA ligase [Kiritimatiellia bacterium]
MKRELIKTVLAKREFGRDTVVAGWVRTRRDSKGGFSFIELNDGSCFANLQILADQRLPNYESEVLRLHPGSSIGVRGKIMPSPGKNQILEVHAEQITVYGFSDPVQYPLQKQRISFERLRELAHLRPRTNTFGAITRIRNVLAFATHQFFQERNFYYIHTPIITANDCEGAGRIFQVTTLDLSTLPRTATGQIDYSSDFFGRRVGLTVSGQLEVETYCCALGNVYTFGPTFRAENSNTRRHLAEFWMVEPEMAFADLQDDIKLAQDYLHQMLARVLTDCPCELEFLMQRVNSGLVERLERIASASFAVISYKEAMQILAKASVPFEHPVGWGHDLQSEHEKYLTEQALRGPVVVINFPRELKAFYMRVNDDGKTVTAMDILLPDIGEIIGGSQREERLDVLLARLKECGLKAEDYWWYCDLRRFGAVPHAGFGLGFERLVQFCAGMSNIRDVIPFARTPGSIEF